MFAEVYPDKDVSDVLFMDSIFRAPSTDFILKKHSTRKAAHIRI